MKSLLVSVLGDPRRTHLVLLICLLVVASKAQAQSDVDSFDPGSNDIVRTLAIQSDGKILVGGDFTKLGGGGFGTTTRNHIGRLSPDGTLDASFDPGANSDVLALAVQPDGKILVVGLFTTLGGGGTGTTTRNFIGRLNSDGTLDTSFNPGADAVINTVALQSDGKIVVGGNFTTLGGGGTGTTTRNRIGRLNPDGTPDPTFDPGANFFVLALAVQADDKILVGGDFTILGGQTRNFIGRLNADGTLDSNFDPGANNEVFALAVQANTSILVGGVFSTLGSGGVGAGLRSRIGRLNPDGTLDATFDPGANGTVKAFEEQADGGILVCGQFTTLGGGGPGTTTRDRIGRLNSDGTLDPTFDPGANSEVFNLRTQTDGKILVVGSFTTLGGGGTGLTARDSIGRLSPPPVIISSTSATGRTGSAFTFQVLTSGATSAARVTAKGLPPGLSVDPVSGIISGAPTADGSFRVTLTVTEGGLVSTGILTLTFTSDPALPVIVSPSSAFLVSGQFFSYTIVAPSSADPILDPTTYDLVGVLPPGLGFDPVAGIISGTFQARFGLQPRLELSGGVVTNVQLFATNSHGTATIPLVFFLVPMGTVNISTRLAVGTGDNVLIGGFIITGNAPKKALIRGIGPSLPVAGALQDTTLELHDGSGLLLGSNDNWRDTQEQEIIATTIPPTNDLESAIVATLEPGAYTAIVSGKNSSTGVGLVEVYDLGTASFDVSSQAQLVNISTRGLVQTSDNVMIGGFIVSGSTPVNVLARAIGPELTASGVAGALQDTTLELRNSNGALLASNDDWESDQKQQIIDTTVAPTDPRESAIVSTLAAGAYTAIVQGKNATTGVGLVEAYVLP